MSSTSSKSKSRKSAPGVHDFFAKKSLSPRAGRAAEPPGADLRDFVGTIWSFYKQGGRHDLPWRKTRDPYKILVSEVMLQQTQVERVVPFYVAFIKQFPTAQSLSRAPLAHIFKYWHGLGYNRRALKLQQIATELAEKKLDLRRNSVSVLRTLPGIGPYTARAVAIFAFNADEVLIETNIRTAVIYHHFPDRSDVTDTEIAAVLWRVLPRGSAREWYSALMDYGSHLKRSGVRINARSTHYSKQAKFEGSLRQVRGAILKALTKDESVSKVKKQYPDRFDAAIAALAKDGMIKKEGRGWTIA